MKKIAVFLSFASCLFSEYAIVLGQDYFGPLYGATVSRSNLVTPFSGDPLPIGVQFNSVSMNSGGLAIFGGQDQLSRGFVYHVSPSGVASQVNGPEFSNPGNIYSVSINTDGMALIGGNVSGGPYASFVTSTGVLVPFLDPVGGQLFSVSINDSGNGILGGYIPGMGAYSVLVNSGGNVTPLSGSPLPAALNSYIASVSINEAGAALIGGGNFLNNTPAFAAKVTSDGQASLLTGFALPNPGVITTVDLNDNGNGVIGGYISMGAAYAAVVKPSGEVTQLSGPNLPPASGSIERVAINSSGMSIIGGWDSSGAPYASFASPDGVTSLLSGDPLPALGRIYGADVDDSGVALVVGEDFSGANPPFAAFISPSGVVTHITSNTFPATGVLNQAAIVKSVVPQFAVSLESSTNTLLAATSALNSHILLQHKQYEGLYRHKPFWLERSEDDRDAIGLVASNELGKNWFSKKPKTIEVCEPPKDPSRFLIWVEPFFAYDNQKKQGDIPASKNEIGGILAALDYRQSERIILGGGFGYAFDYTAYAEKIGHAKINQEIAYFYSSFQWNWVFLNATVLGGIYQLNYDRHSAGFITSKGKTDGWLVSPHLEVSAAPYFNPNWSRFLVESFVMFDWVNNWQSHYTETGPSGLNLVMQDLYTSLLRSEIGLRLYEILSYRWGNVFIEEKVSYINKAPFHVNPVPVFFVGSISSFSIETGSSSVQNLGGVQVYTSFVPANEKYPYLSIDLQGEFGSSFQGYFVGLELGQNF